MLVCNRASKHMLWAPRAGCFYSILVKHSDLWMLQQGRISTRQTTSHRTSKSRYQMRNWWFCPTTLYHSSARILNKWLQHPKSDAGQWSLYSSTLTAYILSITKCCQFHLLNISSAFMPLSPIFATWTKLASYLTWNKPFCPVSGSLIMHPPSSGMPHLNSRTPAPFSFRPALIYCLLKEASWVPRLGQVHPCFPCVLCPL